MPATHAQPAVTALDFLADQSDVRRWWRFAPGEVGYGTEEEAERYAEDHGLGCRLASRAEEAAPGAFDLGEALSHGDAEDGREEPAQRPRKVAPDAELAARAVRQVVHAYRPRSPTQCPSRATVAGVLGIIRRRLGERMTASALMLAWEGAVAWHVEAHGAPPLPRLGARERRPPAPFRGVVVRGAWSELDVRLLDQYRRRGRTAAEIAAILRRTTKAVERRIERTAAA